MSGHGKYFFLHFGNHSIGLFFLQTNQGYETERIKLDDLRESYAVIEIDY